MPPFVPIVEPGYSPSVDPTATGNSSPYQLFQSHVGSSVRFYKPVYDRVKKPVTVFRPFPCISFSEPDKFEPYRKDPGGKNYFGYWVKRVYVAWNVGRPATTFIVHDPDSGAPYDQRLVPLGVLVEAVTHAVKKGQGKSSDWHNMIRRPFDPEPKSVLEWSGYREGGANAGAALTPPKELYLMQGILPVLGGESMTGPGKIMPGWKNCDYTCVFGLTSGVGKKLYSLLNEENPKFRGAQNDFNGRYIHGDPVAIDKGQFIYIYPSGGDPRSVGMGAVTAPVGNIFDQPGDFTTAGGKGKKKEEDAIGFDLHIEATYNNNSASLANNAKLVHQKWKHWDDQYDHTGKMVGKGILWMPNYVEQAEMLSRIFPAEMLVYAFYGQHDDWLTEDVLRKAKEARSASVPAVPPSLNRAESFAGGTTSDVDDPFSGNTVAQPTKDWNASMEPYGDGQAPLDSAVADPALPKPTLDAEGGEPQSMDELFSNMAAEADTVFTAPTEVTSASAANTGFDPRPTQPPVAPAAPTPATTAGAAALAAAKLAARKAGNQ